VSRINFTGKNNIDLNESLYKFIKYKKPMKKIYIIILIFSIMSLSACTTISAERAIEILDTYSGSTELDLNGIWHEPSWGDVIISQYNNRISGKLGNYYFEGTINGNRIYIIILRNNSFYYSAKLVAVDNKKLIGQYYSDITFKTEHYKMIMTRMD